MSGRLVEKPVQYVVNTVEEVFDIPMKVVEKGVVGPLLNVSSSLYLAISLILLFLVYVLVDWKSAPATCRTETGICFKLFKGKNGFGGAMNLIAAGFLIFFAVVVFKITARGVQEHGIKPYAFVTLASFFGIVEFCKVFFEDINEIAKPDTPAWNDNTTVGSSFQLICQQYLYSVIETFRFIGTPFGGEQFTALKVYVILVIIALGVMAGSLARK
jgi:hypothetical protein